MNEFSAEKIKLMQDKGLLHRLYMLQLSGSRRLEPHENAHIADMVLRRKGKKPDDIKYRWIPLMPILRCCEASPRVRIRRAGEAYEINCSTCNRAIVSNSRTSVIDLWNSTTIPFNKKSDLIPNIDDGIDLDKEDS